MIKKNHLFYPLNDYKKKALVNNKEVYAEASKDPIAFWSKLAGELSWRKKWSKPFVHTPPYFKWFDGGKINITESCLEQNLDERKNKVALIWESENPEESPRYFTFFDLYREVNRFANGLKKAGIKKGDRVGIYLPMIPEVVISMLACARIGAIHSVVFSAFSSSALKVRLEDTNARFLITADGYYRRGQVINLKDNADKGMKGTRAKKAVIVKRAGNQIKWKKGRDIWWSDIVAGQDDFCKAEEMDSEDVLFILYTSGSTGKPKGIVHTCGGYAVQAKFTGKWLFDLKDDDIFWSTADVGWITGHTYSVYSPLLNGTTALIFEGAPDWPEPDRWSRIIEKYGVTTFYTAPTAVRMFAKYGAEILKDRKMKTLQLLGSVGEPIDYSSWLWFFSKVGKERCPLVDTWWQTETGGILISSLPGVGPFRPTFTGLPFPGIRFDIIDDNGKSCRPDKPGNLVILPPFSPGLLRGVYKNEAKYKETYWSQYADFDFIQGNIRPTGKRGRGEKIYFTSDVAYRDKQGLIRVVGRSDDVIKVAGHRMSTGEMENVISKLPNILECAVIGMPDEIKGETPAIFAVLKNGKDGFEKEIIAQIKKEIGPIALPKAIYPVDDLPKTRSGKIMRRILRNLFIGEKLGDLSTLANPEIIEKIARKINN